MASPTTIAPDDAIPLPRLPRALRDRFGLRTTYQRLYSLAVNGTAPIEQNPAGRYSAAASALPEIARLLGHPSPTEAAP